LYSTAQPEPLGALEIKTRSAVRRPTFTATRTSTRRPRFRAPCPISAGGANFALVGSSRFPTEKT